jgi:hypothetical protein
MSTTDPKNAYPEPACDFCRHRQDDHHTLAQRRASDTVREFPPLEGEVVSTCVMCACEAEPAELVAHSGMAMNHPDIQQKIYATNATLHSLRRLNGAAWIATRIMESLTQDTHMVIHPCKHARCPGCDSRVAIHVVLDSISGAGRDTEIQGVCARLQLAGFVHDDDGDSADPQAGIARSAYRHPVTRYRIELVLYGAVDTDPNEYAPLSATTEQVSTMRRDFFKNFLEELSSPGASS